MKHFTSNRNTKAAARCSRFHRYALATFMLLALAGAVHAQSAPPQTEPPPQVNLNTADAQALQYLPGIGPGKSAAIIRVREESGAFAAIEDLLQVPGIGEMTLLGFRPYVTLEGGVSTLTEAMAENPPSAAQAHSANGADATPTGESSSHE